MFGNHYLGCIGLQILKHGNSRVPCISIQGMITQFHFLDWKLILTSRSYSANSGLRFKYWESRIGIFLSVSKEIVAIMTELKPHTITFKRFMVLSAMI